MSNPFLNPKKSSKSSKIVNNRFHSLQQDDTEPCKDSFNQKTTPDSSSNTFTQPLRQYRDRDRDRDSNYRKKNDFNKFKNRNSLPVPPVIYIHSDKDFPDLVFKNDDTTFVDTITDFKQILSNKDVHKPKPIRLPPGWVTLTMNHNTAVYENVHQDLQKEKEKEKEKEKDKEKEKEKDKDKEKDIHDSMNTFINSMREIWDKYENEYDEINGEGSYDEKFRLDPVYGSEYDSESDEEMLEEELMD